MGFYLKLLIYLLLSWPLAIQATALSYHLKIVVNPSQQTINGLVHLSSTKAQTIELSTENLSRMVIDKKPIDLEKSLMLKLSPENTATIQFTAELPRDTGNWLDENNAFLTQNWYPKPNQRAIYRFMVTFPRGFIANAQANAIRQITHYGQSTETFIFDYPHPLDNLKLLASKNFVVEKDNYKDIEIVTYFFPEEAHLAKNYIEHAKYYLKMYEELLTPYPFKRFAIVENIAPTGLAMPTFTLLGREVVKLPFIVKTSLGHEILHNWFGNYIYVDDSEGNWVEGLTSYLSDQHYAALAGKGAEFRKQILLDYQAYAQNPSAIPVRAFTHRYNKLTSVVGYGKAAMIFHQLRQLYGDELFFATLKQLLKQYAFKSVSWQDIIKLFAAQTGEDLTAFFSQWLQSNEIPELDIKNVDFSVVQGQMQLQLTLTQQTDKPFIFQCAITIHTLDGQQTIPLRITEQEQTFKLNLSAQPLKIILDANYDLIRHLIPPEIPPRLASLLGQKTVLIAVPAGQQADYIAFAKQLGIPKVETIEPMAVNKQILQENSLLLVGEKNPVLDLFAPQLIVPAQAAVDLQLFKNPYQFNKILAVISAEKPAKLKQLAKRIKHYGKYSQLSFDTTGNIQKRIYPSANGIEIYRHPAPLVRNKDNQYLDLKTIIPDLQTAKIIYIGEQHDQFAHHLNQLWLIQQLQAADQPIAIGLEMLPTSVQTVLDDYIAGFIDEATFLQDSDYFRHWGFNYNLYKPIFDYAHQMAIPLIALNIPREVTHQVAQAGLASLSEEQQQYLPSTFDFTSSRYQQDLFRVFNLHAHFGHAGQFEHFLQAQTLWDETMAQQVDNFLQANPQSQVVVLAGNGHLQYGYGIPKRVYRYNQAAYRILLQDEPFIPEIADYVIDTTEVKGQEPPILGVRLEEIENAVVILEVQPDSAADLANLQQEDIIVQVGKFLINTLSDLKYALFYADTDKVLPLVVLREGEEITVNVEWPARHEGHGM